MQIVVVCNNCKAKNRVDETRLSSSEAKCGRCGAKLEGVAAAGAGQESKPLVITDQTFEREVLAAQGKPVLVDCWAPWCGPCRIIGPVMDQLAAESQGQYRIAKLNVDDNPQVAARFQIASIPTMLIFKDGKLVDRLVGVQPKPAIAERLKLAARFAA
ncbi:MAG TPA: thioredoxin [Pyrinomonadaceae bacterium]|jgi:thioredoxin|nr:thioredoxin [Pyrinomonadaceae bacterium]